MPSPASPVRGEAGIAHAMPASAWRPPLAIAAPSPVQACEYAVLAIWRSLDEHDLLDEEVRDALATVLEPLTALALGERPRRLIDVLREPNPLDPSHLYWLTRRLLTLVPELQALAAACGAAARDVTGEPPIDAIQPTR